VPEWMKNSFLPCSLVLMDIHGRGNAPASPSLVNFVN
jgi:hypothetical protein